MPLDPPRCSGLRPSVLWGTCLLTSQCPSTSKVNENPALILCSTAEGLKKILQCTKDLTLQTSFQPEVQMLDFHVDNNLIIL